MAGDSSTQAMSMTFWLMKKAPIEMPEEVSRHSRTRS